MVTTERMDSTEVCHRVALEKRDQARVRYVVTRDGHSVGIRIVEFEGGLDVRALILAVRDRGRMECADQLMRALVPARRHGEPKGRRRL